MPMAQLTRWREATDVVLTVFGETGWREWLLLEGLRLGEGGVETELRERLTPREPARPRGRERTVLELALFTKKRRRSRGRGVD